MADRAKLSDLVPSRFVHLTPPNEENIERIRADLEHGSKILLNNPHVFKNEAGKYEILAGHDRVEAARRAGWAEVPVREFRSGLNTDDDILAHFCKENLLRKETSKAAIAGEWLKRHPDWSDGLVAENCGCTQQHVSDTRAEMIAAGNLQHVVSRVGRDAKKRDVGAEPRAPRQKAPKRGPLAKPSSTLDKPKSKLDALREAREAQAERVTTTPAPQAVAPKAPSVGTGVVTEERSEGTPEPEVSSSTDTNGEDTRGGDLSGEGEPSGVVSESPSGGPISPIVGPPSTALSGVEGAADDGVTRFSLAAEFVTRLPDAPVCPPAEHRLAFHVLPKEEIERVRLLHRWLGTFLLQVDIERDNARKETVAA